jgi:Predicted Zn-dependent peptidases
MSYNETASLRSYSIQSTKKFPTITIEVTFSQIQKLEDIEARNLVAKILPQVLAAYPDKIATKSYFSDLYAAKVLSGVKRDGDKHEVAFQFVFTDPQTIADENYQLDDIITCVQRVLLEPALENNTFMEKAFTVENSTMQAKIASMYDDKSTYAQLRLLDYMFVGTPFAIRPYGKVENYQMLTNEQVYQAYQKMLAEDSITISVVGNVTDTVIKEKFQYILRNTQQNAQPLTQTILQYEKRQTAQRFVEKQVLNQTKLHIGYHIPATIDNPNYFAHRLAIEILGGGAQSKLFQNVREKASLAYYVSAVMDLYAEAMYIYAGIDHGKIEQAHQIILEQIESMIQGNITEEEILLAKNNMLHRISMSQDNAFGLITLQRQMKSFANINSLSEWQEAIKRVEVADIIAAVKTWKEDTIFILTNEEEEGSL